MDTLLNGWKSFNLKLLILNFRLISLHKMLFHPSEKEHRIKSFLHFSLFICIILIDYSQLSKEDPFFRREISSSPIGSYQ